MDLNRAEAQKILHEMKREIGSSSLLHREKAPDQSYINASVQNLGKFGQCSLRLYLYFGQ